VTHARAASLAAAAADGFSESALRARGAGMAPGALAIAQRLAPYSGSASEVFGDRQSRSGGGSASRQAAAPAVGLRPEAGLANPAARPYRASGGLGGARAMDCLTQAVYYEARGETPAGQAAVAQVVLNRVRHPAFPKTVCGVVFQGARHGRSCQFSFVCDGSLSKARETGAWLRARKIAARALAGFVMADVGNATHFHTLKVGVRWGGMIRVSQVGLHVFYRFGGHSGAPGAFRQTVVADHGPHAVYASILPVVQPAHPNGQPAKAEAPAAAATPVAQAVAAAAPATPALPVPAKPALQAKAAVKPMMETADNAKPVEVASTQS
jgi:spore germination cell wall hydrolase CwlJ-like protein